MTTTIVDLGIGNVGAVQNMLKKLARAAVVTSVPEEIETAGQLLLPGVGSFDAGMSALRERGLEDALTARVEAGVPVIGICLGMQLLGRSSEEGTVPGLGWLAADVVRLSEDGGTRVPHMGWSTLRPTRPHPLVDDLAHDARFYFAHSYAMRCDDERDVVATSDYGAGFVSVVAHENVMGVQFHPEKSHRHGMELLARFIEMSA